jgi:hypothetical protein
MHRPDLPLGRDRLGPRSGLLWAGSIGPKLGPAGFGPGLRSLRCSTSGGVRHTECRYVATSPAELVVHLLEQLLGRLLCRLSNQRQAAQSKLAMFPLLRANHPTNHSNTFAASKPLASLQSIPCIASDRSKRPRTPQRKHVQTHTPWGSRHGR